MDSKLSEALRATPGSAAVIADKHGLPVAAYPDAHAVAARAAAASTASVVQAAGDLWRAAFGSASAPTDVVLRVESEGSVVTASQRGQLYTAIMEKTPR